MNVLSMGLPFGTPGEPVRLFRSSSGHEIRTLAMSGGADYHFAADETAADIVARIRRQWPPDLLLCWCPERLPPPRDIEHCPIRTAAVISDWTVYYPQLAGNLGRYDAVVCDRLGAELLRAPGVTPRYIGPLYSQRTGIHRNLRIERDLDVVFAGNLNHATHVRRGRLLEQVAALSDRRRVVIASGLPPEEYTMLLNRARIVFNFALRREMNLRCFEALACGAMLFLEQDNLEAPDYLENGESAVFYDPEHLAEQLDAYLDRPAEIERIAANGHARGLALAGEHRLDGFIDAIAAMPDSGRPSRESRGERKDLAEVMQYISSMEDAQRAYGAARLAESRARHPGATAFLAAHGCDAFERMAHTPPGERKPLLQTALHEFRDAATGCPEAIPLWLNLGFIARQAHAETAENRFLALAMEAQSLQCGEFLLGERRDFYYGRWREALAFNTARPEMLWAAAAARRAALAWDAGDTHQARIWAEKSIEWMPESAAPYQILAKVAGALGHWEEAAALLERSLGFTALDSDHRMALADAYRHAGRMSEARALAEVSARIFTAWWGAEHAAQRFLQWPADCRNGAETA